MREVVDRIVVSESVVRQAERSDSDSCVEVQDVESFEGRSDVLGGGDQLGQSTEIDGVRVNQLVGVGCDFRNVFFCFFLVLNSGRDDVDCDVSSSSVDRIVE